jgi:hypothetical protein
LATQKRKHHRKDNRVSQRSWETGLTRPEHTTRTRGEGQEETRAEREEEGGGHEQVGLGEHETHRLGDEAVHEEEHEGVEKNGHLVRLAVHELDVLARGGDENTGAEREKKGGGDSDLLGSDIGEHLIYIHIIFYVVNEMIERSTAHHLFMKTILSDDSPDMTPDVIQNLFML